MELSSIVNIFDALLLVLHEHKILFKNVIKIDKLYISSLKLYEVFIIFHLANTFK